MFQIEGLSCTCVFKCRLLKERRKHFSVKQPGSINLPDKILTLATDSNLRGKGQFRKIAREVFESPLQIAE